MSTVRVRVEITGATWGETKEIYQGMTKAVIGTVGSKGFRAQPVHLTFGTGWIMEVDREEKRDGEGNADPSNECGK